MSLLELGNRVRSRFFASDYSGVTHAGIALVALDTGRVFLAKRAYDETDAEDVRETWEFPGGGLKDGEEPYTGAVREVIEETGWGLPDDARVTDGWRANEVYQGFVVTTQTEFEVDSWTKTTEVSDIGWFDYGAVQALADAGALRPEIVATMDWSLVFPETKESDMTEMNTEMDYSEVFAMPIPIHGVLAPEETPTGDRRGFAAGAITKRPLRLPFRHQEADLGEHKGAYVVGSVDRLMRKDGKVHYEGALMPSARANDFIEIMEFFDGRYGVSVDGDNGSLDMARSKAENMTWFDSVRASGLTAVDIPAFAEAYVAFGPHPDMPADDSEEFAVMVSSGDIVGRASFKRGPGWVTNPKETNRIHDYWTKPGQPGYQKIRWGTPGDFRRAKALIGEKIAKNSPEKMRFLNQIIAQWHFDALGYWPGDLGKPGNAPDTPENRRRAATHADGDTETFKEYTAEERKKAHTVPGTDSFPIEDCEDLKNAIQAIGRAKDPAAAKRHIRTQKSRLGCPDVAIPDTWAVTKSAFTIEPMSEDLVGEAYCIHDGCSAPGEYSVSSDDPMWFGIFCADHAPEHEDQPLFADIKPDTEGLGWEAVLTSSAGVKALPPASYFDFHEDSGATVIEKPDEFGYRRTYGYAGEWGVCHIGKDGRCVEVPEDPTGEFRDFHLGRFETEDGYLNVGVVTYKVDHRDAQTILTETVEQQHFDNIEHAWAAVRLGQDDRGIWFSGVVLPHVPEDDLVLIEAAGQVSGEWLRGSLRALQAVNVPGFPVLRSSAAYDDEGNVIALVASISATSACEPDAHERMQALARADADARFEALKKAWVA